MITLFFTMVLLTVSWSLGWKVIISKGMLLEDLGAFAENKLNEGEDKANKAKEKKEKYSYGYKIWDIVFCPWCIPNFHGLFIVWPLAFGLGIMPFCFDYKYILIYPFVLCASSFITGVIWSMYMTMNAKKENYEWSTKYYDNAQKYYYNENKKVKEINK